VTAVICVCNIKPGNPNGHTETDRNLKHAQVIASEMKSTFEDQLQQPTARCTTNPPGMKKKARHEQHIRLFLLWEKTHNANDLQFKNKPCKNSNKLGSA